MRETTGVLIQLEDFSAFFIWVTTFVASCLIASALNLSANGSTLKRNNLHPGIASSFREAKHF